MPRTLDGTGWQTRDTSHAAARAADKFANGIKGQVLAYLRHDGIPRTTEEIARALGLPYGSVQPRTSELCRYGLLFDSGIRKVGRYGKDIIAWTVKGPIT